MKRPLITGEIVGRRGWRVDKESVCLGSSWATRGWFPGENRAECVHGRSHRPPNYRCECGLYAVFAPQSVLNFMHGAVECGVAIVGLITAWGDLEVHIDGFRASHARVAALVDDKRLPAGLAQRLAYIYGVPLISYENWLDDSFIAEFGQIIPFENRPRVGERRGLRRWCRGWTHREQIAPLVGWPTAIVCAVGLVSGWWYLMAAGLAIVVLITLTSVLFPDWWDS